MWVRVWRREPPKSDAQFVSMKRIGDAFLERPPEVEVHRGFAAVDLDADAALHPARKLLVDRPQVLGRDGVRVPDHRIRFRYPQGQCPRSAQRRKRRHRAAEFAPRHAESLRRRHGVCLSK